MQIRVGPPIDNDVDLSNRRAHRNGNVVERKETVTLVLEKQGRKWRFVDVQPRALFDPPEAK